MQLTKYGHSCVRIDDGDRSLVLDPGAFSDLDPALDGVGAVLITHEHADHVHGDRVRAAAQADPRLRIWAPAPVAATFADLGDQVVTVRAGDSFDVGGFGVQTFGGQHALIHPLIPVVANVACLIDGAVYHPGDSFTVPQAPVSTLLFPAVAPWSKMAEVIDFLIAIRAPKALPIHDAVVNDAYRMIMRGNVTPLVERFGVELGDFAQPVTA